MMGASLALVMTARNGLLFLAAWEVMALVGFFLIVTEANKAAVRRAGFVYLAATHVGTLALFALFALLSHRVGSFAFPAAGTLAATGPAAAAIFALALVGFGFKAGLMPLHLWLPDAHAAAPSHVSALLSGVMIKAGIYGLVRVTGFFTAVPPWWGGLLLAIGAVSGVLGVVFAIAQHDLKRLLAYHSVENIGIIAIGLGVALLGRSFDLPAVAALGLAGALLHVINHGLFKSLLFLSSGAVIHATGGERDLDRLGGLLRQLPWSGACFLGGAVAISGLPPLNGFVSEWLIYLGAFRSLGSGPGQSAVIAAPVLALIGALALACFVKAFGAVFLGTPRHPLPHPAHEAPVSMRWPPLLLLLLCAGIGLWPAALLPLLGAAVAAWGVTSSPLAALAPAAELGLAAWALLLLVGGAALWLRRRRPAAAPRAATWGCGYQASNERMQYTASSFADGLTGFFRCCLGTRSRGTDVAGLHPGAASLATETPDAVLDRAVLPASRQLARGATWLRARLQHGVSSIYLLYVALTVVALLAAFTFLRG
jgi:hydrogenase-4 component B